MRHDQRHRPRGQHQPLGMRARRDRRLAPALPTLPPWPLWTSPWKPAPPPPVATPTRGATSASSTPPSRSRRRTPVAKHSAQPARRRKDDQHVRNELERLACQLAHQLHPMATTVWILGPKRGQHRQHRDQQRHIGTADEVQNLVGNAARSAEIAPAGAGTASASSLLLPPFAQWQPSRPPAQAPVCRARTVPAPTSRPARPPPPPAGKPTISPYTMVRPRSA